MTSDTHALIRPLRADAERNRARVVVAAREVFAQHGLGVTLDDVARHAGVGVGTVYRRFPNKEALVSAVFDHVIAELINMIHGHVSNVDAWRGLTELITEIAERQSGDRGLYELCTKSDFGQMDRIAAHFTPAAEALVSRAQAEGSLRPDFSTNDIGPMILMIAAVSENTRQVDPDAWRRYLILLLDGLRAPGATPLPGHPLSHEELKDAMCCGEA
ncbi:TetR/AcrR family transcriptional regulator [Actinokineospora sp. NBRC 105648]|uniref:TetR/AcrR family transcriptional regulator n=1 Tax=Actinokineospora sp. NBRC 105648 TaxID=3032206 RepID=UPI0024A20781|nr:TetR/AcrR family transcriptional regulator [Actinokineospora sp. NBRC 105648]GLZ42415.1 TetR family transcriptional regulator [Actinokineospora sp. NBRC 105648]